jgi:DEAD/DEAH box helicase domain-containing protein
VGLSAPLFDQGAEVVAAAQALVAGCDCRYGCPACVGPVLASDEARGYSPKSAALQVLELLGHGG